MWKRRAEIAALAALILLAAGGRPAPHIAAPRVQIADLEPVQIDTARDLGVVAVKLLVDWID